MKRIVLTAFFLSVDSFAIAAVFSGLYLSNIKGIASCFLGSIFQKRMNDALRQGTS